MNFSSSEFELLLEINSSIATIREKEDLFRVITDRLQPVFEFEDAVIVRINGDQTLNAFLLCMSEETMSSPGFEWVSREQFPVQDGIADRVLKAGNPIIFDVEAEIKEHPNVEYLKFIHGAALKEIVITPLSYVEEDIGLFFLQSRKKGSFTENHFPLLQAIAQQLAIAVNNIIANERLKQSEEEKRLQLELNNALIDYRNRTELCKVLAKQIHRITSFKYFEIIFWDKKEDIINEIILEKTGAGDFRDIKSKLEEFYGSLEEYRNLIKNHEMKILDFKNFSLSELTNLAETSELFRIGCKKFGIKSFLKFPIRDSDKIIRIMLFDTKEGAFAEEDIKKLRVIAPQILLTLENLFAYERIEELKEQLEREKVYLTEEIKTTHNFEEFVGQSKPVQAMLKDVEQVAPTDATVLVQGESGTGKELIARAIHNLSQRSDRPLVKVDCATLPASLIESELFGHEKGSFTGASDRRIGKFELADQGTIFLDEVGELPQELQVKLLRVLQERQFERLGSNKVIKIDVRVIAATNRDLQIESMSGNFRQDLFYRLNVFPIEIPPLRKRKEDIPLLANHFLRKMAKKMGKNIDGISNLSMEHLMEYEWPGNVRELEHVIERAVILESNSTLHIPALDVSGAGEQEKLTDTRPLKTLDESQRDHILKALRSSGGRIRGEGGAAELLDIKPTTLESRMKRLGIKKEYR